MTSDKFLSRIRAWRRQRFGVPLADQSAREMAAWLDTPLGRALLAAEQVALDGVLQDLFGYHLLQISVDPALDITGSSRITHRVTVALDNAGAAPLSSLIADPRQLPLASGSVDLVVLHHALDFSPTPHQLLREAQRVLIPRGYLVVVGFNPWSGFGLTRYFTRLFSRHALWRHQPLRLGRLLDWLQLLDLEPDSIQRGFYRLPVQHPGTLRRLQWCDRWGKTLHLPGGAFYQVVACKELGGAIPVKPSWERRPSSLPGLGVQPMRKDQKY
ncbi:class I SAM-dependent methyltransferase [Marinimicrobium sp. C6131]|uniref:class I SAM-dependent methyltransferase n=1 Tax=Marinimicrobium sp. C6131 TaxID=3022676 RepID=UPI00223D5F0E|nr:class I SAM-dependent methyltransferase [Marinimicrobium sp. C6131]UZJ45475.1 class I SAM-dependent methyltransferase [Marinimicrobium sp. C6131]